jgi:hypothetical protein
MPRRNLLLPLAAIAAFCSCGTQGGGSAGPPPMLVEKTIGLPNVSGRIDHLAYEPGGRRLFVAALGNGSVEAIDLAAGRVAGRITGLHEPQGLAWLDGVGELAIASGDGTLRFYQGNTLRPVATLQLGEDADNLRVDARSGMLVAGFGSGAIATVDPVRHAVVRSLKLPAHPEGFRLEGDKVYVNLPDAGQIVVGDLGTGRIEEHWPTGLRRLNFPMALESASRRLAVAFRLPARLAIMDVPSGRTRQVLSTCGDSDDLFFDTGRRRLYVICGSGEVEAFREDGGLYSSLGRVATRPGARTGLLVPEEDRLFVAARSRGAEDAAILVLRAEG